MNELTWLNDFDEECLLILNDLISAAKDLHSTMIRQYVKFAYVRKKGIATEEVKQFKDALDELKESFTDLESVFFFLPKMPEFVETTQELSLV